MWDEIESVSEPTGSRAVGDDAHAVCAGIAVVANVPGSPGDCAFTSLPEVEPAPVTVSVVAAAVAAAVAAVPAAVASVRSPSAAPDAEDAESGGGAACSSLAALA